MLFGKDGIKEWRNEEGELHRKDGPARIHPCGTEQWYLNGKLHRDKGPAVIHPNGKRHWWLDGLLFKEDGSPVNLTVGLKQWWINGKLHRKDGPAVIKTDGYKAWHLNGKLHRKDGPAIIYPNGQIEWWLNNVPHREDGPAIIHPDGSKKWFLNGEYLTEEEFLKRTNNKPKKSPLNQQLNDEFKEIIATISAQQTAISLTEIKKFKEKLKKRNEAIKLSLKELDEFTISQVNFLTPLIIVFFFLSGLLAGYLL